MAQDKIRVGIVGVNPNRGFASVSHVPALQGMPDFEIVAVCGSTKESAEATAQHYGIPLAFGDAAELAQHPDVDLVTVCLKVPNHFAPVMAAIEAGKDVYCEWPLGKNTSEATQMLAAAESASIRHAVGLQGEIAPGAQFVREMINEGFVGKVLAATLIVSHAGIDLRPGYEYQASRANGSNALTILGGHSIDLVRFFLGPFKRLNAIALTQIAEATIAGTEQTVKKDTIDQLVIGVLAGDDIPVSFQLRSGGVVRDARFVFEIHGEEGDFVVTADPTSVESMQRGEIAIEARRGGAPFQPLSIPDRYRVLPADMPKGAPYNVGQLYARFGEAIRSGAPFAPDFSTAVGCHEILDAIMHASDTGTTVTF